MLKIRVHKLFKKDLKRIVRRGYNLDLLRAAVNLLVERKPLPEKYKDHWLTGDYAGYRECHITPDWLLVYQVKGSELILVLSRTGTHSDLF